MFGKNKKDAVSPNWAIIGGISFIAALIFFAPFLGVVALSALFAYLLFPLYVWLLRHKVPVGVAGPTTLIASYLVVAIPLGLIATYAVSQGFALAHSLAGLDTGPGSFLYETSESVMATVNNILQAIGSDQVFSGVVVRDFFINFIPQLIGGMAALVTGFVSNLPNVFVNFIIYSFLFVGLLRYHKEITDFITMVLPFDGKRSAKYLEQAGAIISVSLSSQFVISLVTAVTSALLLFVLNMQPYFFFFVILFTLLGMIPLGSGIVMIPIGVIAMLSGNFWPGLWVLIIYLGVICNIDNFLRPRLVSNKVGGMVPALTTLATFSGLYYFGILGLFYGPVIVVLLLTTAQIYVDQKGSGKRIFDGPSK